MEPGLSTLSVLCQRKTNAAEHSASRGSCPLRSYCKPLNLSKGEWIDILAMWCVEALGDEARFLRIEPIKATADLKDTATATALAATAFSQLPARDQNVIMLILQDKALLHAAHTFVNLRNSSQLRRNVE